MSRRYRILSAEQIITVQEMYHAGAVLSTIAAEFGCSMNPIIAALRKSGVVLRKRNRPGLDKPSAEVLRREYWDERQPATMLAKKYGVHSGTIGEWMNEYGIPTRSFSEAKKLDWERWGYEDRLRLTADSRAIFTGKPRTDEDRHRRAKGVERAAKLSTYEQLLLDGLHTAGLKPIPQYAVERYNIDFALPEFMLAIEVQGGNWHQTSIKKRRQDAAKFEVLRRHGWDILLINTRRPSWVNLGVTSVIHWLSQHPSAL